MQFHFDWSAAFASIPSILTGVPYTLLISLVGVLFGLIIGIVVGLMRLSPLFWVRWLGLAYTEFFRGTPVLVQVLFIFYGLPAVLGHPLDPLIAGIAAIAVNSGAYISEVVLGGIRSIDKGQHEAGLSLGLGNIQVFGSIIWPQALRRMLPSLGNQVIISIKDTSIFSIIGVGELVRQGQIYIAATFNALETYFMIAITYLVITLTFAILLRLLERSRFIGRVETR